MINAQHFWKVSWDVIYFKTKQTAKFGGNANGCPKYTNGYVQNMFENQ